MTDQARQSHLDEMYHFRRRLEAFRRRALLTVLVLAALGAALWYQVGAVTARRDTAIVAVMAQALAAAGVPEAVIIKVSPEITYAPYRWLEQTPLGIWQAAGGEGQVGTPEVFDLARQRRAVTVLAYSIEAATPGRLLVKVAYFYPAPAQPEAPHGGYASRWQLREAAGGLAIESEVVYLYWD